MITQRKTCTILPPGGHSREFIVGLYKQIGWQEEEMTAFKPIQESHNREISLVQQDRQNKQIFQHGHSIES